MEGPTEAFAQWLERAGKSPATVRAYTAFTGVLGTDALPAPVVERAYDALARAVAEGSVRPATANVRVAALRAYVTFLRESGAVIPVRLVAFRLPPRTDGSLPREALDPLLDAPAAFETDPVLQARDATLLAVLACVPLRVARIARLTREDARNLPLSNHARHWMRTYLARRRDTHPALFLRHDRAAREPRPLTPRTIERVVARYAARCGIPGRVTPDRIRATLPPVR